MARECQEKNAKGLTMVAVGVNKAAEQYLILDERTREELASGKYHDQRRGSFGTSAPGSSAPGTSAPGSSAPSSSSPGAAAPTTSGPQSRPRAAAGSASSAGATRRSKPMPRRTRANSGAPRGPWTRSQEKLALLYNQQGLRPGEIAQKLGVSPYIVTQIILSSRNRGKL
ncbi:MAG: hypothetical protein ACM3ML_13075 [Micromonosporaceae bacterium]